MTKGKVYLVGAGPGDKGLITVKGLNCIKNADVIVYDRLVNLDLLKNRKHSSEIIYVGKESKYHAIPQSEINEIIVKKAQEGKVVVRLKGGDPYVFGRGGEEGEILYDRGIEFEVIPGITSAIGGLCYAGIPVTHRDFAASFHVITGHSKKGNTPDINWEALAKENGTVVFLMSIGNIEEVVTNLISNGRSEDTNVAFVSWASSPNQKKIITTLKNAIDVVKNKEIEAPALFVVGDVVTLSDKLDFFEKKPLFNKRVLLTRNRNKNSDLREKIEDLGGEVVEIPTIKIETNLLKSKELVTLLDMCSCNEKKAIAFTSHNSVKSFFELLRLERYDIRKILNYKIYTIGRHTSIELEKYFIFDYIESGEYTSEGLAKTINRDDSGMKIIYPCSNIATNNFENTLSENNSIDRIEIYNNVVETEYKDLFIDVLKNKSVDYITFTSSSTVKNAIRLLGEENKKLLEDVRIISIGKITSSTIEESGLKVYKEAKEPSIYSMLEEIK